MTKDHHVIYFEKNNKQFCSAKWALLIPTWSIFSMNNSHQRCSTCRRALPLRQMLVAPSWAKVYEKAKPWTPRGFEATAAAAQSQAQTLKPPENHFKKPFKHRFTSQETHPNTSKNIHQTINPMLFFQLPTLPFELNDPILPQRLHRPPFSKRSSRARRRRRCSGTFAAQAAPSMATSRLRLGITLQGGERLVWYLCVLLDVFFFFVLLLDLVGFCFLLGYPGFLNLAMDLEGSRVWADVLESEDIPRRWQSIPLCGEWWMFQNGSTWICCSLQLESLLNLQ